MVLSTSYMVKNNILSISSLEKKILHFWSMGQEDVALFEMLLTKHFKPKMLLFPGIRIATDM